MTNNYAHRTAQILSRIEALAAISEDDSCLTRTFGTRAFNSANQLLLGWMLEAGLEARIDNMGNVRGLLRSAQPNARTFFIGSHLDTVVNAGRYDGPLGVLMGLDLLSHLTDSQLPFNIGLVSFCDEEGVRFHTTYLGSKTLTGHIDAALLNTQDANGCSISELIGGDVTQLQEDSVPASEWLGYFEIHIEQGPVLYEKHIPVGLVTAIAGQLRCQLTLTGMAGHAGTVPMEMRQDALCCAAECILLIEQYAFREKIVATVGTLQIIHAAPNVIPGEVTFSIDLRSDNKEAMMAASEAIQQGIATICGPRNINFHWEVVQETAPVLCDESLCSQLEKTISANGYELVRLVSGAGHDGVEISTVAPVSMLFVRCFKGISHHPLEAVEATDVAAALQVAEQFIQQLMIWKFQH